MCHSLYGRFYFSFNPSRPKTTVRLLRAFSDQSLSLHRSLGDPVVKLLLGGNFGACSAPRHHHAIRRLCPNDGEYTIVNSSGDVLATVGIPSETIPAMSMAYFMLINASYQPKGFLSANRMDFAAEPRTGFRLYHERVALAGIPSPILRFPKRGRYCIITGHIIPAICPIPVSLFIPNF